jgi:hypothetical protein
MARKQAGEKPIRVRKDGRHQLLVYVDPGLIKELKKAAIDDNRNVYEIVEDLARNWLTTRSGGIRKGRS